MLIHYKLEKNHMIILKVNFNLLLRAEQLARENKDLGPFIAKPLDFDACWTPEPVFQRATTLEQLDKIICSSRDRESEMELKRLPDSKAVPMNTAFLTNPVFRKTYFSAKKEIDEWMRSPSYRLLDDKQSLEPKLNYDITPELLKE